MAKVKRVLGIIVILALLIGSSAPFLVSVTPVAAEGDEFESVSPELAEQLAEIYQQKQALTPVQRKIDWSILQVIREVEERVSAALPGETPKLRGLSTPLLKTDDVGNIEVKLIVTSLTAEQLEQLEDLGMDIRLTLSKYGIIEGSLPYSQVEAVAGLDFVVNVGTAGYAVPNTGPVTSEGDTVLRAAEARTAFGVDGSGVKVGVISDGVTNLAASVATGDLPAVQVLKVGSDDEGTAMLEIVHDLAPGSPLAFYGPGTSSDMVVGISALETATCDIIVDDLTFFDEPKFEDGPIAQEARAFVLGGGVYVTAAGNNAQRHYGGTYVRMAGPFGDYPYAHDYGGGDIENNFTVPDDGTITTVLQWNNQWGQSGDDFDLFLVRSSDWSVLKSSTNWQDGTGNPWEGLDWTNDTGSPVAVFILVVEWSLVNPPSSLILDYHVYRGSGLQYVTPENSVIGHSAVEEVLSTAAAYWGTPDTIEHFSSRGPGTVYFPSQQDRQVPNITGVDGVQTKTGQLGYFGNPFYGTSAAAPHVAAIAALVWEANPTLTSSGVFNAITSTAVDLGPAGYDYTWGFGRVDAYNAVNAVAGGGQPDITVNPTSFDVTLPQNTTEDYTLAIGNNGDATLTYNISDREATGEGSTAEVESAPILEWDRTFGGTYNDYGHSVQQTSDGGYIIAGCYSYSYGAGRRDVWLIKTDSSGNKIWDRTFGGTYNDEGYSVQQTSDGGYIIAGYTYSYGAGGGDVWLIKTDSSGNKIWDRTFGGGDHDEGYSVQQTSDGGYIIAGSTASYGAGSWDAWLIKTNADGNKIWDRTFGGKWLDGGRSVRQMSDGGYIIAGYTYSYGAGGGDVWLIKTDSSGNQIWDRTFGGTDQDKGYSVRQTSDGGYIIAGETRSYGTGRADVWLIKADSSGNKAWDRTFGGTEDDRGRSVEQTSDGGYIIAGETYSYGAGDVDVWLIKTDSSGNKMWDETFGHAPADWGSSVRQTTGGGYIIAGTRKWLAERNVWLLKLKPETADCPWLDESPSSGSVGPGNLDNITVTINTTGLGSDYSAQIVISSNDPNNAELTVPVTLVVTALPSVTTNNASNITSNSATLNGNLDGLGAAPTVFVSFEYGLTTAYGNETTPQAMTATGPFSFNLSSLSPNTTYHFRGKAVGNGTNYGLDKFFTTLPPVVPPATSATRDIADQTLAPGEFTLITVEVYSDTTQPLILDEDPPVGWGVTLVDADGATYDTAEVKWFWSSVTAGETKTAQYELTVPLDAPEQGYVVDGVLKSLTVEWPVIGDNTITVGFGILDYYRGLDGDPTDVSDGDLLQAAYDWAHHVIPGPEFSTWLTDTELLELAYEWAS